MEFIKFNQLEIQSSLEYWTDERMANATPYFLPQFKVPQESQQKNNEFAKAEAEMFCCYGYENNGFDALYITIVDVDINPYRQAGQLYFIRHGIDWWASAQFVGAKNIIMTAAHCLKTPCGEWSSNMIFSRACINGRAAQNINIAVGSALIQYNWNSGEYKWDYGFAKTTLNSNVGYLNLGNSIPYELKSIGYPMNCRNLRRYMCEVRGTRGFSINGEIQMEGNFMSNGASGGAWFAADDDDDDEVVGLNSSLDLLGNVYGPIFDSNTIALLDEIKS